MLWKPYNSLYVCYYYVNVMNALDIYVDVIDSSTPATVSEIFIIVFLFVLDVEIFPIRQVSIRYADQPLKSAVKSSITEARQDEKTSN